MTSRRTKINDHTTKTQSTGNNDIFSEEHSHPRVTVKKTFTDIHRKQRSAISPEVSESNMGRHPRIQWSAGTTNVGSHHGSEIMDEYPVRDHMQPILRKDSSDDDLTSPVTTRTIKLPPAPDTWGAMDAEPTRIEEIEHAIAWSPILERSDVPQQKSARPRTKFLEKFRKRSNEAIIIKIPASGASHDSRSLEDGKEDLKPEEEFRRLNERYLAEGVITLEDLPQEEIVTSGSRHVQSRFSLMRAGSRLARLPGSRMRKSSMKSYIPSLSPERDGSRPVTPVGKDDRKSYQADEKKQSKASSFHEKRVTINVDANEFLKTDESPNVSPLPARRSCEPVEDLRKLREPDSRPGPSGILPKGSDSKHRDRRDTERPEVIDPTLKIRRSKISNVIVEEPSRRSEPEESADGTKNKMAPSIDVTKNKMAPTADRFKMDDPFSELSIQTRGRDKKPVRSQGVETGVKKISHRLDLAQPSTSKGVEMESYRRKVSQNEINETHEKNTREQSSLKSTVSRTWKTSFLDKAAMADRTKKMIRAIRDSLRFVNVEDDRKGRSENGLFFGTRILFLVARQVVGENVVWAYKSLKNDTNDFDEGTTLFNSHNRDLQELFSPLMENTVNPTVNYILRNFPLSDLFPKFGGKTYDQDATIRNRNWIDTIDFFGAVCPFVISNFTNVSQIHKKQVCTAFLENLGPDEIFRIVETLQTTEHWRFNLMSFLPIDRTLVVSLGRSELMEKIARSIVDIILSKNEETEEFLFLSFGLTLSVMSTRRNFQDFVSSVWSFRIQPANDCNLSVSPINSSIGEFISRLLNFYGSSGVLIKRY